MLQRSVRASSNDSRYELGLVTDCVEHVVYEERTSRRRVVAEAASQGPAGRNGARGSEGKIAAGADERPVGDDLDPLAHDPALEAGVRAGGPAHPDARTARVGGVGGEGEGHESNYCGRRWRPYTLVSELKLLMFKPM